MHITIENNTVIVNLDETEFPLFEAMFANLKIPKQVSLEFRHFSGFGGNFSWKLSPMHLCRTIGEANLSADPFATVSLYPFWKYGFAFGNGGNLELALDLTDPHKKGVAADEFGMGFTAWAMEEIFHCETWADASAMIKAGLVVPTGSRCPDFVCTFPDGSLGIFEAKGTTGTTSALNQALANGKQQAMALSAESPIKYRVVIGTALGGGDTKIILVDPPGDDKDPVRDGSPAPNDDDPVGEGLCALPPDDNNGSTRRCSPTNLSAPLVRDAARKMRASIRHTPTQPPEDADETRSLSRPIGRIETPLPTRDRGFDTASPTQPPEDADETRSLSRPSGRIETPMRGTETTTTIFRGPTREIALTHDDYRDDKHHGWLDIVT